MRNNKDKVKQYNENRRHKNHKITKQAWMKCKDYFDNSCAYCGITESEHKQLYSNKGLHKEHIDHEGSPELDNCVPACYRCNSTKWIYPMEEWYRQQEFFSDKKLAKIYKWINEDCNK